VGRHRSCFNEAAADAAEFCAAQDQAAGVSRRFNEAAADAAEFSRSPTWPRKAIACFNEAAADAAEFSFAFLFCSLRHMASMRPRQMPRNFLGDIPKGCKRYSRFNEAAADAAEFSKAKRS